MKLRLLSGVIVAFFSVTLVPSVAFAENCPDRHETSIQTNQKFLEQGKQFASEALEHAQQGHQEETVASGTASLDAFQCIVSATAGAALQTPRQKIRVATLRAKKGEMDKAVVLLEEAVAKLDKVKLQDY